MDAEAKPKKRLVKAAPRLAAPAAAPVRDINENLTCPVGGTEVFARIPQINLRSSGVVFPAAAVHLRYGKHFGANKGFGFQHIWAEHYPHIGEHDVALEKVRSDISAVLRPGTEIFHESARGNRLNVHRLHLGLVIVTLMPGKPPVYSIVTGGYNPGQTKGSLVGALV